MAKSNYALRLQSSLKAEAEKLAAEEGTTLNQLINIAVAEKIAALRTAEFILSRGKRAGPGRALEMLRRSGANEPPQPGDEVE
jgi:hypothetical protein